MSSRVPVALFIVVVLIGLVACGGGNSSPAAWTEGVFPPAAQFEQHCPTPRTGKDTYTGISYTDVQGSITDENNFLRSWINAWYLWYREVPDLNPGKYSDPVAYFGLLKTTAVTSSGRPKDRFHFTYPTPTWEALSLTNVSAGYGFEWQIYRASGGNPPLVYIAYLDPQSGTPARNAGLVRGDQLVSVDGVAITSSLTQAQANTINAGLFPATVGESHTFGFQLRGGGASTVPLTSINAVASSAF